MNVQHAKTAPRSGRGRSRRSASLGHFEHRQSVTRGSNSIKVPLFDGGDQSFQSHAARGFDQHGIAWLELAGNVCRQDIGKGWVVLRVWQAAGLGGAGAMFTDEDGQIDGKLRDLLAECCVQVVGGITKFKHIAEDGDMAFGG